MHWKAAWPAIGIVGFAFLIWDVYFTKIGVWGFTADYLLGIQIFGLPLEEILFFICIPYACLFTYYCLKLMLDTYKLLPIRWVTAGLIAVLFFVSIYASFKLYTTVTFGMLCITLAVLWWKNPKWLARLYTSLLMLILPFLIVNGILTGTGLETQVVWYNPNELIGFRVGTIPVEDFAYGTLLIILNVSIFEYLNIKQLKKYFI